MKPVTATLHAQGVCTIAFIDDVLVVGATAKECSDNVCMTIQLLKSLGFLISYEKSTLKPSQSVLYLGFIINSVPGTLSLPEVRITKIINACQNLLKLKQVTLFEIAHVTGLLVSAFPAVRYLELCYRSLEYCKSHELHLGGSFDDSVFLSYQAKHDLAWIICNIRNHNGKTFRGIPIDLVIECDASNSGWGATCNGVEAFGEWSLEESNEHINFKELQAAFFAIQSFHPLHKSVHHI